LWKLIDILLHRHVEQRREEIARSAKDTILDFRAGRLKAQSAKSIISELRSTLDATEEE
jgi:2,3-bisphosphoglycerate-independent phosphoglycerate mutase